MENKTIENEKYKKSYGQLLNNWVKYDIINPFTIVDDKVLRDVVDNRDIILNLCETKRLKPSSIQRWKCAISSAFKKVKTEKEESEYKKFSTKLSQTNVEMREQQMKDGPTHEIPKWKNIIEKAKKYINENKLTIESMNNLILVHFISEFPVQRAEIYLSLKIKDKFEGNEVDYNYLWPYDEEHLGMSINNDKVSDKLGSSNCILPKNLSSFIEDTIKLKKRDTLLVNETAR
jgi:hypothetical protein